MRKSINDPSGKKDLRIPGNIIKRALRTGKVIPIVGTLANPGTQEYKRIMADKTLSENQNFLKKYYRISEDNNKKRI
jgi:hypothetical protein